MNYMILPFLFTHVACAVHSPLYKEIKFPTTSTHCKTNPVASRSNPILDMVNRYTGTSLQYASDPQTPNLILVIRSTLLLKEETNVPGAPSVGGDGLTCSERLVMSFIVSTLYSLSKTASYSKMVVWSDFPLWDSRLIILKRDGSRSVIPSSQTGQIIIT